MPEIPKLPNEQLQFIRSQVPAAVPLLARLYDLTEEQVRQVRIKRGSGASRMPLRLLQELVEQRTARFQALDFVTRNADV